MKRFACILLTLGMLLSLTACGGESPVEQSIFAMDTYMTLTAYGDGAQEAVNEACRRINQLERSLSRTIETSDIYAINSNSSAQVDDEVSQLIQDALRYSLVTGGAFDITIAPLVETWQINSDAPYVPTQEEIDQLLPLVGIDHVHVDGNTVTVDSGSAIDLGGIAKGYASDAVAKVFAQSGVRSGSISLGGNVYVCGSKPDGSPWSVGIQDPKGGDCAAYVELTDAFAVTSGGYQRYYTAPDGTVYQHIIDPKTGYPARSDLTSVTIIGKNGTRCDAYSTALYVMGEQKAIAFWESCRDFDMVLITADGRLLYTPDLTVTNSEGSTYDFQKLS